MNPFLLIAIIALIASFNTRIHLLGKRRDEFRNYDSKWKPRNWWMFEFGILFIYTFIVLSCLEISGIIDFSQISWHLFGKIYLPIIAIFGWFFKAIYAAESDKNDDAQMKTDLSNKWSLYSSVVYAIIFLVYIVIWCINLITWLIGLYY